MYNQDTEQFLDHVPLTEEEALGLLPKGTYEGYIRKVEIKPGKKDPNARYFVASVEIFPPNGKLVTLNTWLVLPYLLKHMYDACGKEEQYKTNRLSTKDCEGFNVSVRVGKQEGTEQYPQPKNVVQDFMKLKDKPPTLTINGKPEEEFYSDEVPF